MSGLCLAQPTKQARCPWIGGIGLSPRDKKRWNVGMNWERCNLARVESNGPQIVLALL